MPHVLYPPCNNEGEHIFFLFFKWLSVVWVTPEPVVFVTVSKIATGGEATADAPEMITKRRTWT